MANIKTKARNKYFHNTVIVPNRKAGIITKCPPSQRKRPHDYSAVTQSFLRSGGY